jgi:hypothetical protein
MDISIPGDTRMGAADGCVGFFFIKSREMYNDLFCLTRPS